MFIQAGELSIGRLDRMISLAIDQNIAIITLCHPPANAISEEWLDSLDSALEQIEADSKINVIRVRSSERLFCAGADLKLMASRFDTSEGRNLMVSFVRRIQKVFARLENMTAVSVAEIGGAAMGGGLELALSCDLRVVADNAKLGLPEARLGLLPGAGGTQRMTRRCGDAVARRLILGAEIVDGKTAQELNVAQWSVPGSEIVAFTDNLVGRIGTLTAQSLTECKRCISAAHHDSDSGFEFELAGTHKLLATEETQERVRRFLADKEIPRKDKSTVIEAVSS
ncbi:MAG: enoyl-CoA hydratase/isomerase family protein [Fimbriimonadaceae bacterium]|nr:enoyl-CoA hydratase/isomerase family protein [Alphaproteobacteria bacterium]